MKKEQTSVRAGIEDILFPMETCRITQGDKVGTHSGTFAVDLAGKDGGRDLAFFPFSAKSVALDSVKNGNAVVWESLSKVRFADGTIDYACIMIIHDNDPTGFEVGKTYKQGQQMAQEGTAGDAAGNHLHIEIAKGTFTRGNKGMYTLNEHGVYHLTNNIPIEDACFMDDTKILEGIADWKYVKDVPVEEAPITKPPVTEKPVVKPPVTKPPLKKPDQILRKGEKFKFNRVYKVDDMKKFKGKWAVLNRQLDAYLTVGLLTRTNANGAKTASQVLNKGDYFVVPGTFIVDKTVGNSIYPKGWGFGVDAKTLLEV